MVEGVEFAIDVVERAEDRVPIPVGLLAQTKVAARRAVSERTVLLRLFAGSHIFADTLREASAELALSDDVCNRLQRNHAAAVERLISVVVEEYEREQSRLHRDSEQRQESFVTRLLRGELLDTSSFAYDFDAFHLAVLAKGEGAEAAIDHLALELQGEAMVVRRPDSPARWAWIARREPPSSAELDRLAAEITPFDGAGTIGEFCHGLSGWRLSHEQCRAVFPHALRQPNRLHRYSAVALAAVAEENAVLKRSLQAIYLEPIFADSSGGILRDTLKAYFAAGQNGASAAAALGVTRQTVASRLRVAETRIGRSLHSCAADLAVALCLPIPTAVQPHQL